MENKSEKTKEEEVFIGARSLEGQVNLILPTYDLLLEQIKQIRQVAENAEDENKGTSKKENNNTIGIFGARGTGKTSVLYTIMEQLKKQGASNIILPIVEPDNFGENTKIIGSIVGLLSAAVDEELEYIKNHDDKNNWDEFFNNCIYKENNPLNLKRKELIEYYMYTESEYRKLLSYNFDDIATHIKKTSYLLIPDIEFKKRLSRLIDLLIESREKRQEDKDKKKEKPMVFIFIDDIDLKTTKCRELIDSILQYSNHSNVITLLSGDYDILKESVTLSLIADENLAHSNLRISHKINTNKTILERKLYLANEYLKKIIPPARRHNLINWNIENIPNFAFGERTLLNQLDLFMGKKNLFGYRSSNKESVDKVNPIKISYSIFDKTPRGLINVYYHISQIIKSKDDKKGNDYFKNIKVLIDTIMVSSKELIDEQKYFFEKCLLWGDNADSTFIDYNKIPRYLKIGRSTYIIHENLFNLFLICEILKQLFTEVGYIDSDYNKIKDMVLEILYVDPKDKLKNKEMTYDKRQFPKENLNLSENSLKQISSKYIYRVVLPIGNNIKLRSSLILLENLISSELKEDYVYNSRYYKEDEYKKNKNVFMSIYKLVTSEENEDLLKILYLKNYNENAVELNTTFDFLENMCSTTSSYDMSERIFEMLLKSIFKEKLNISIKTEERQFNSFKLQEEYYKNRRIKRMILINTFIKIQGFSKEDINQRVQKLDKISTDYKQFKFIRKLNDNISISNSEVNDKEQKNIKRVIEGLGKYIQVIILEESRDPELKLHIHEIQKMKMGIEEFYSGEGSRKQNTSYYRTLKYKDGYGKSKNINEILSSIFAGEIDIDTHDYINMLKTVERLATNNKVWYGRTEAIKFLSLLKEQFHLDIEDERLKNKIPIIYELAIYLKESDQIAEQYDEFEKIKIDMREKLKKALNRAKNDIENELDEIGIDLEEEEENHRIYDND